jgi:hypothetical protein
MFIVSLANLSASAERPSRDKTRARSFIVNVWRLVTGDLSIDRNAYLLSSRLPWWGILASLFVAALMVLAAALAVQRRDF